MSTYHNFIGIDIGKFTFVVATHDNKSIKEYENVAAGIKSFMKDFNKVLPKALVVLEATGGYEKEVILSLVKKKIAVHRANTRHVKNFIRSYGNGAKTDALDAKALAFYGYERHHLLELHVPTSDKLAKIYALAQRRQDLNKMLVAEKNRAKGPNGTLIQESCVIIIKTIKDEIDRLVVEIEELIQSDNALLARQKVLQTVPGVGKIISQELLAFMPELGTIGGKQSASLGGLAPRANDSGKHQGYRMTGFGRGSIRPSLFLAAMAARNSKSDLAEFYKRLINRGKKKMVALTALMRKIIVICNARLRDHLKQEAVAVVGCEKSA